MGSRIGGEPMGYNVGNWVAKLRRAGETLKWMICPGR